MAIFRLPPVVVDDFRTLTFPKLTGLDGRRSLDPACWSAAIAWAAFINLCREHLDDEQHAYNELLEQGCPLMLADATWDLYVSSVCGVVP